ncbi:MAG: hypothetical protein EX270_12800, partial [Pseudomonadales bacterium]
MKKQFTTLAAAVACAAGFSTSVSAGILSANVWSVLYPGETMTLSANGGGLYFQQAGALPPGTFQGGETVNITQWWSPLIDDQNPSAGFEQMKNYSYTCIPDASGNFNAPGTVNALRALTVVQGNPQLFVGTQASPACNVTFGATGEITNGYIRQELFATGPSSEGGFGNIYGAQLWSAPRRTITWNGDNCDSSGLSNAVVEQAARDISADYDAKIAAGTPIGPGGLITPTELQAVNCTTFSITPFSLGYCDPVSTFGNLDACKGAVAKAVPVPAFAAGILGLGLMGIT